MGEPESLNIYIKPVTYLLKVTKCHIYITINHIYSLFYAKFTSVTLPKRYRFRDFLYNLSMSKVNWGEALALYVTQHTETYGKLAKRYGVAKSTIVRHAVKHNWQKIRVQYRTDRLNKLTGEIKQARVEADERHLVIAKLLVDVSRIEANRLAFKLQEQGGLSHADIRAMGDAIAIAQKGIKLERILLGLPTRPVRMTDPQAFAEIKGPDPHLPEEPWEFYKYAKKAIKKLDRHRDLLQRYIDKVEETGGYVVN